MVRILFVGNVIGRIIRRWIVEIKFVLIVMDWVTKRAIVLGLCIVVFVKVDSIWFVIVNFYGGERFEIRFLSIFVLLRKSWKMRVISLGFF